MQDPTSSDEPMAFEDARKSADLAISTLVRLIGFTIAFSIAFSMYRVWNDDELRLHWLHAMVRILQEIARVVGLWALEFEQAYNEFADSLH